MIATLRAGAYNSPFAFLFAMSLFGIFHRLKISGKIGACILYLGGSMFFVYLFHPIVVGSWIMQKIVEGTADGVGAVFACVLAAGGVFCVAILADIPRRCFVVACDRPIRMLCQKIDAAYEVVLNWLVLKLT